MKNALIVAVWLAISIIIAGCAETAPEISGNDNRLLELEKQAAAPYAPKQQNLPAYKKTLPAVKPGSIKGKVIIIDAGHGGKDPGTIGIKMGGSYGMPEKSINLDIAKKVAAKLTAMGAIVKMTRTTDVFIELEDRGGFATRYKADMFVALHTDYIENKSYLGPTAYISKQASPQSVKIANIIDKEFKNNGITTRGVRRADYKVLINHSRPATLVEVGYLSNYSEAKRLNTDVYRTKLAAMIADGIAKSF